jgi:hypothetical protein
MIGQTLLALRTKVRQLIQTELSVDTTDVNSIDGLLNIAQRELSVAFDWEQLHQRVDVSVASMRITLPTAIDFDRQCRVSIRDVDVWRPVEYGITEAYWNVHDVDDFCDPIQRWQRYGLNEFEVWPSPASSQTLRFSGTLAFTDMTEDAHTAVLDDVLLALAVATEILMQQESKAAGTMLQRYQKREAQLRRNNNVPDRSITLDGMTYTTRQKVYVVGSGGTTGGTTPTPDTPAGPLFGRTDAVFGSNDSLFGQ